MAAQFARVYAFIERHLPALSGVGITLGVVSSMYPQTFGLGSYRRLYAQYDNLNVETVVDDHTLELSEKVLNRIELKPEEEASLSLFTTSLSDVVHFGSLKLHFGGIIGVPSSYSYKTTDDIQRSELKISGVVKQIDWDSAAGQNLAASLVLSDKAKAFAIAREVKYVNKFSVSFDAFLRCATAVGAYTTGHILGTNLHLKKVLKLPARIGFYGLIATSWLLLYIFVMDTYTCRGDLVVDKSVASLTRAYAEGGVEYYNKLLERNKALRSLLGESGASKYTVYGNETETWRRSHVQLISRRHHLQLYMKDWDKDKGVAEPVNDQQASVAS